MKRFTLLSITTLLLSACVSAGGSRVSFDGRHVMEGITACMTAANQTEVRAMEVPASNNIISNKLLVASIPMNGSNAVDALTVLLPKSDRKTLMIYSNDDEVAFVTLEAALSRLKSNAGSSAKPVCYVGAQTYAEQLMATAKSAGVLLVNVQVGNR